VSGARTRLPEDIQAVDDGFPVNQDAERAARLSAESRKTELAEVDFGEMQPQFVDAPLQRNIA